MGQVLAAIGEALIDFIPAEKGCAFYEVTSSVQPLMTWLTPNWAAKPG